MGQKFGKWVKTDGVGDVPSTIDSPVRFERLRELNMRRIGDRISVQGLTFSDTEILTTHDSLAVNENPDFSDSLDRLLFGLDSDSDVVQNPVASKSDQDEVIQPAQAHIESAGDEDIQQSLVSLSEEKLEDGEKPSVHMQEINSCMYVVGEMLAKSAFVTVYAGTRVPDGLEVALKYIHTTRHVDYISIPNHPEPLPREVAFQMIACEDRDVPEIAQLLDWKDYLDHYVMVVERPSPCQGLDKFVASQGGKLDEELAKRFMWQATLAACMCLVQGVFHRNVTLENLLVKTDTMDIRLIGFGCGDLFKRSTYKTYTGTRDYICPEFFQTGEYYAKLSTVYSLGVLLFAMLCGRFPNRNELVSIKNRSWYNGNLTFGELFIRPTGALSYTECCHLIEDCLQEDPEKRIDLEDIFDHNWFEGKYRTDDIHIPEDDESRVFNRKINGQQYEIGGKLGRGGFGTVYKGIRVRDGLKYRSVQDQVAVKFVKNDQDEIHIPGYRDPFPREVALHKLACAGEFVPVIGQFLDWQNYQDHYVLVLEHPCPCMDVAAFVEHNGGTLPENIARVILSQAAEAAEVCCNRGVFHRDIKLENLLINRNTLEVKLIDFGCGDLLKSSSYNEYMGTPFYTCPEYLEQGKYHGKPATVYSLGVLLFFMLCGDFPGDSDRQLILEGIWHRRGLTQECCRFVEDCLQRDPEKRIDLEMIRNHKWFQVKYPADAETPVHFGRHDVIQYPYCAGSEINDHVDILESQPEEKLKDEECRVVIREIHDQLYGIGRKLGQGICEGIRLQDCLKVTVKFVKKTEDVIKDYIYIPGWPTPFPREVGLQLLASKGGNVPMIIKLLDWQDYPEEYIMVLECPSHFVDVGAFLHSNGGTVAEYIAQAILGQAAQAAQVCCKWGVFHGDIKLENLLINPNSLQVKLMAFGCGDLLKSSTYNEYMGTKTYTCPEYLETGEYHGRPATVYSLGILLFALVCGQFPSFHELQQINDRTWSKDGLTAECCDFIHALLQRNPDERIHLENIFDHAWI